MSHKVELWSIERVLVCLKRVVHQDVLPSISQEELDRFDYREFFEGKEKALEFLKFVYEKSNNKLEIYGNVDEMMENLRKVDRIPEFIRFSSKSDAEVSFNCAFSTTPVGCFESIGMPIYYSRSDIAINAFRMVGSIVSTFEMDDLTIEIFSTWHTLHLNTILRKLKGSYNFPPLNSVLFLCDDLTEFHKAGPKIEVPEEPVTFESFSNLRTYFDPKEVEVLDNILKLLKNGIMDDSKQEHYKKIYAQIVFLIGNIKKIYDRHAELFIPSSELKKTPTIDYEPVIRLFENQTCGFYCLSKEVRNSMQKLAINKKLHKQAQNLIVVESDEERKNGIVYATLPGEFKNLLKILRSASKSFVVPNVSLDEDYQNLPLPIISSYGTHCMPALDAFCRIVYYLAVILKVFQRTKAENLPRIFRWIDDKVCSLFVKKSVFYLIELWKIDEILDNARKDLTRYLTEAEYEVPLQSTYSKNNVYGLLVDMLKNFEWEKRDFLIKINYVLNSMVHEKMTIKNVYSGYSQMVRLYLQTYRPKVAELFSNQSSYISENETFTEIGKESEKQESGSEQKTCYCCTGNQVEKKLRGKKQLKGKKSCLKPTNGRCEKEHQGDLEKFSQLSL